VSISAQSVDDKIFVEPTYQGSKDLRINSLIWSILDLFKITVLIVDSFFYCFIVFIIVYVCVCVYDCSNLSVRFRRIKIHT